MTPCIESVNTVKWHWFYISVPDSRTSNRILQVASRNSEVQSYWECSQQPLTGSAHSEPSTVRCRETPKSSPGIDWHREDICEGKIWTLLTQGSCVQWELNLAHSEDINEGRRWKNTLVLLILVFMKTSGISTIIISLEFVIYS